MSGSTPIAPVMEYPFPTILDPVRVPPGCYPIEVTQYWRGEYGPGFPLPLHWAIVVRTSAKQGNFYEVVGDTHTYDVQARFDVPLSERGDWRGGHVIGYVSPDRMEDLMNHLALVPIVRERWTWNCQNWIYDALEGLNRRLATKRPGLYIDVNMTFGALQTQMCTLLEAWEIGDI